MSSHHTQYPSHESRPTELQPAPAGLEPLHALNQRVDWPRPGGVYRSQNDTGTLKHVYAIEAEQVYYSLSIEGVTEQFGNHCVSLDTFRRMASPEDQSPIPALEKKVEALREALEGMIKGRVTEHREAVHISGNFCYVCGCNDLTELHDDLCPVRLADAALLLAGEESAK